METTGPGDCYRETSDYIRNKLEIIECKERRMAAWIGSLQTKIMNAYYGCLLESADVHNQEVTIYY